MRDESANNRGRRPVPDLAEVRAFLPCETPDTWVAVAVDHPDLLLIDHAHCEKKAASTALNLMFRYVEYPELLRRMSRLAREELRHFEQVLAIMQRRGIAFRHLTPSRYAAGMRAKVRTTEPERLVDLLIVGAYIEARSCERFGKLAPHLDNELERFYAGLCRSESRHFRDYLDLARGVAGMDIGDRIEAFAAVERALASEPDTEFRFHSGPPSDTDESGEPAVSGATATR